MRFASRKHSDPRSYWKIKLFALWRRPSRYWLFSWLRLQEVNHCLLLYACLRESSNNPVWFFFFYGLLTPIGHVWVWNGLKWEPVFCEFLLFCFGKANTLPQPGPAAARRRVFSWTTCMRLRWASNTSVQILAGPRFLWEPILTFTF